MGTMMFFSIMRPVFDFASLFVCDS